MSNEIQQIAFAPTPTSGAFGLTFNGQTTGAIDFDASQGDIQTALEALSTIGSGNVLVTGEADTGAINITFQGALANTNVPQTTCDASGLSAQGSIGVVSETQVGATAQDNIWQLSWSTGAGPGNNALFTINGAGVSWDVTATASALQTVIGSTPGVSIPTVTPIGDDGSGDYTVEFTDGNEYAIIGVGVNGETATETQPAIVATPEIQTIPQPTATGGTFTVAWTAEASGNLAWNITQADLSTALNALSDITTAGGVTVSGTDGGPWIVTWNSNGPQTLLTLDGTLLANSVVATASTTQEGAANNSAALLLMGVG